MSDNTHTRLPRALAGAGMLLGITFARPGVTVAQNGTPEHGLLNRVPAIASVPAEFRAIPSAPAGLSVASGITGEQALLDRTAPRTWSTESELGTVSIPDRRAPIDEEAALIGRPPRLKESR